MATIPSPRTWATGDTVTAAAFNDDLRDSQQFLLNRPRVFVYDTGGISSGPGEVLHTWNTALFDTDGMHSTLSNTSRLTVVTSGVYEVILHIDWEPLVNANGATRFATIQKNNSGGTTMGTTAEIAADASNIIPSDPSLDKVQTNHVYMQHFFTAGDYIEAVVRNTSTTARSTNNGNDLQTFFAARWIGSQ